jgi:dihydroneopterin aldolase
MDLIRIKGLRLQTHIGWTDDERSRPQWLVIDVDIALDLGKAARSDDLADTLDYHAAVTEIAELVRASRARLLEHLAWCIAELIGGKPGVEAVTVEVAKESPPLEEKARVAVRVCWPPGQEVDGG